MMPRRRRGRVRTVAVLVTAGILAAGCTASAANGGTAATSESASPISVTESATEGGAGPPAGSVPAADRQRIRDLIATVNAGAGDDPAVQRAVLQQVVVPSRADEQRRCDPASTTVRFEPAWDDLRRQPGDAAGGFVLPTLIRIFVGSRAVGTDVTALTISVDGGGAHLPPLCIA